jgi:hypothetical protein
LRFEPFTSSQIGRTIAKLAEQIVASLERERPAGAIAIGAIIATARGAEGPATSREGDTIPSLQLPEIPQRPTPKSEPPTRIVDALRGHHTTLSDALEAAEPGDRILVRPGVYKEGIVIDKPVEIIGDGELNDVVIEANGRNTILCQANMARIANVTLRQTGGGNWYCVDIGQGRLDLDGCDISSLCYRGRPDHRSPRPARCALPNE